MRLANFLGNSIASSFWFSFIEATNNSQSKPSITREANDYFLEHYHLELNANMSAPLLIVPLMKNNDPNSPIWVFKLGNLSLISKQENIEYQKFDVNLSSMCFEVLNLLFQSLVPFIILSVHEKYIRRRFLHFERFSSPD